MILASAARSVRPDFVVTSPVCGIDFDDRVIIDLVRQIDLDHVLVILVERLFEDGLLRERLLRIEDDELRLRLLGLQEMADHAGPLVGTGRAAIGIGRRGHDDETAVRQRQQLFLQEPRLLAALPGVRHQLGGIRRIAFDRLELEIDARRDDEPDRS